jgi:hypothetical protein
LSPFSAGSEEATIDSEVAVALQALEVVAHTEGVD